MEESIALEGQDQQQPEIVAPREPASLRKAKKKKLARIVFLLSTGVMVIFIIIALLGQNFGNYTIKLDDPSHTLSLGNSLTLDGDNGAKLANMTANIAADGFKAASPMKADDLPAEDEIDPDIGDATIDLLNPQKNQDGYGSKYDYSYRYTFYLANTSPTESVGVSYYVSLDSVVEPTNLQKSASLVDIIRVRIYDTTFSNDEVKHNCVGTYARKANTFSDNGSNAELITKNAKQEINKGYCTNFLDDYNQDPTDMTVMKNATDLTPKEIRRYTVVIWLEGYDPDCQGENPKDGALTLSMHFSTDSLSDLLPSSGSASSIALLEEDSSN